MKLSVAPGRATPWLAADGRGGKSQFSGRDLRGECSVEIQSGINDAGVKQQCSPPLVLPVPLR